MTDYLTRAYRLQLTTAIENLMRTAVVEISQIFEASLRDHQLEIARKGDEVDCLRVKLQSLQTKLKDISILSEIDTRNSTECEEPNKSTAPELDFEAAPDDWCVPLGSENVPKQEIPCPSVRLKQFSIPLWPLSLKHEAFQKLKERRLRPRRNRVVKELKDEKKKPQSPVKRSSRIHPLKEDRLDVPLNIKEEPSDSEVQRPLRRRGLSGKVQKTHKRARSHQTQHSTTEQNHQCRFCPKGFDTATGLGVHERAHKKCQGCKRIFPFPSVLMKHKNKCKYYKALKLSNSLPETSRNSRCTKHDSSTSVKRTSVRRTIKGHSCKNCLKKFASHYLLLKHSCKFSCQLCHKTFPYLMNLKVHTGKMHKNSTDLSWTKPLDEFHLSQFETNIMKCRSGFQCLICKKIYTNRFSAVEHSYSHTGEKPFKCDMCAKKFAHQSTLSHHRKKSHGLHIRRYARCACSMTFVYNSEFIKHKLNCPAAIAKAKNKA